MVRPTIKPLTQHEQKMLDDVLNPKVVFLKHTTIQELVYADISEFIHEQHRLLEEQFKAELSKIKFRGEITPEKVKRHGFKFIHHEGVGTYITRNSIRVTDIFFKCSL